MSGSAGLGEEPLASQSAAPRRRWLRPAIAVVGYGLIAWLAVRSVDRELIFEGFRRLPLHGGLSLVALALLHVAGRAYRYHRLLLRAGVNGRYRWRDGVTIFLTGLSTSAVTPARAGDIVKARLVKPFGVSTSAGVGLVLIERMLDLLVMLLAIVGLGTVVFERSGKDVWSRGAIVLLGMVLAGIVVLSNRALRVQAMALTLRLLRALRRSTDPAKLETILAGLFGVWDTVFHSASSFSRYLAYSAIVWFIEFGKLWLLIDLLGHPLPLSLCLFIYPLSILAGVLTVLPFSEGVVGVTGAALLVSLGGLDPSTATLAIILDRSASSLPPLLLWGAFALSSRGRKGRLDAPLPASAAAVDSFEG